MLICLYNSCNRKLICSIDGQTQFYIEPFKSLALQIKNGNLTSLSVKFESHSYYKKKRFTSVEYHLVMESSYELHNLVDNIEIVIANELSQPEHNIYVECPLIKNVDRQVYSESYRATEKEKLERFYAKENRSSFAWELFYLLTSPLITHPIMYIVFAFIAYSLYNWFGWGVAVLSFLALYALFVIAELVGSLIGKLFGRLAFGKEEDELKNFLTDEYVLSYYKRLRQSGNFL
ncbi:MAG: hypothetical protein LBS74_11790 [Oscillospiraceae bacterium]|nr:hypothetical protein [Oscillospiraceae bacterium]